MGLNLKTFSEISRNLIESLAVLGGVAALWKYLNERKDRATDILLKLENEFCKKKVMQGAAMHRRRQTLSSDKRPIEAVRRRLAAWTVDAGGTIIRGRAEVPIPTGNDHPGRMSGDRRRCFGSTWCSVGVRQAKQVPERSLSTCFRFWLRSLRNPKRTEFREYIDSILSNIEEVADRRCQERTHVLLSGTILDGQRLDHLRRSIY
jgi:hypothetical protein